MISDQGKPGKPGHQNIGRGSCQSMYSIYGTTNVLGLLLSIVLSLSKLPHHSLEAGEALAPLVLLLELVDLVRDRIRVGVWA